ncbi:MAG: outer membrane beta-barrel protein [Proteobacteria bacterium]|nr:outer membrane beta-barrel protein [Pseudomonadota bacterium]
MTKAAWAFLTGLVVLCLVGDPVLAQNASGESVRSRPRLDYESFGLSFRAFLGDKDRSGPRKPADQLNVFTRVDVGAGYRSNVLTTPNNERGSTYTKINPRLAIRSDWDRHAMNLTIKADADFFLSESSENKANLSGRLDGRYDITDDKVARWGVEIGRRQAIRGSGEDAGPTFEPQIINQYIIGAGYTAGPGDKVMLSGNAQLTRASYEKVDGLSRDALTNTQFVLGGVAALYSDGPINLLFVPGLEFTRYDESVNSDSISYDLAVGWRVDSSALTAAEGKIGVSHRDFDRSGTPDITSLLLQSKLLWNPTQLISLRSNAFVQTDDTQSDVGVGKISAGVDLNIDYELFENLVFTSGVSYANDQFKGVTRTDDTYRYNVAAMYLMGEHYFIRGDLKHTSRGSDNAAEAFDDTTIFLRFGVKTCCLSDTGLVDAFGEGVLDVFR